MLALQMTLPLDLKKKKTLAVIFSLLVSKLVNQQLGFLCTLVAIIF